MAAVVQLPQPTPKVARKPSRRPSRASAFRRHGPAAGLGAVILVLLGLSLSHLSTGVQIVTHCSWLEALAMAVGLDLLIVGLEVAMVTTAGTRAYRPVARFANPALVAAFMWSAGLNAFAFSAGSTVLWMTVTAASLGASIPALIFAGVRSWAALAIESRRAA
jgi:hypothetical protein